MATKRGLVGGLMTACLIVSCLACARRGEDKAPEETTEGHAYTAADTLNWNIFVAYLRDHFDDFHDVTMRFHHQDAAINGVIELRMKWDDGRLTSADVISNETGSDKLATSLIEKMRRWNIEGLSRQSEIFLPVNVRLVGLDDPTFPDKAMLSGKVTDTEGSPVSTAVVELKPRVGGAALRAQTNREGIFIRTLIPPGTWDVECSHPEFEAASERGIALAAGQHTRVNLILGRK